MSNKNTIARVAAALADREAALEATRKEYATVSTEKIEAKLTSFAEVVHNTRRKMDRPAGFDWALHRAFKVVAINETHFVVEAAKGRTAERVRIQVPRSDLSLSTWQITGIIRATSAERGLAELSGRVAEAKRVVAKERKDVREAEGRLRRSEERQAAAQHAVDRRLTRMRMVQEKKEAARGRRQASKALDAV